MDNNSIVIEGLKKGLSKMAIMTNLIRNDSELDLTKAAALYKKVGSENNLILDNEAKDNLTVEIATKFNVEGKLNREDAVTELMNRGAMTKNAAVSRLKSYCIANKIDFPQASTRVSRDMEAVKAAYKTWHAGGYDRNAIESGLREHYGYTEKNVGQAYLKIGKELGLIQTTASVGRTELATWFANADNVKGEKKDVVAKLIKDTEIAPATAESRYAMYLFAVEYAKMVNPAANTGVEEAA